MTAVPFDTLRLARDLEAAGFGVKQAQDTAAALANAFSDQIASRADVKDMATKADLAELKADLLKWMIGLIGFQTVAVLGGVATLLRAAGH